VLQNPDCDCDIGESGGCGCPEVRAAIVAYNRAYVIEDGHLVKAGEPVQLGTGSRQNQEPESAGRSGHTPGLMAGHPAVPGPMVPIRCADDGAGDGTARDPFCISKALCVITGLHIQFQPDTVFEALPTTWSKSRWSQSGFLQRPSKWGYPGLLRSDGRFQPDALGIICSEAIERRDRLILRVHVTESNTSLHCVAVMGDRGVLVDPADIDAVWPLHVDTFKSLRIDRVRTGYKFTHHK